MNINQKQKDALLSVFNYEKTTNPSKYSLGWRWSDVRISPATLNNLIVKGLIEERYRSNSYRGLLLTDLGREKARQLADIADIQQKTQQKDITILLKDGIFDDIIGHEDIKELLKAMLLVRKPLHVLLTGPPALAKSLFLWDIEHLYREQALWLVGSATSKAGLWDLVAERNPQILLIDELDKMNAVDTAALLSLMEGGRLVRAKKGRNIDIEVYIKVVAATNRVSKISEELLSRFAIRNLKQYSQEEYMSVVKGVLVRNEGINPDIAGEIAAKLATMSQDVRDAVRVARLSGQMSVDKAIYLLLSA